MKASWAVAAGIAAAAAVAGLYRRRRLRDKGGWSAALPARVDRKIAIPTAMAATSVALWMKVSHGNTLRYTFVPSMIASWAAYMLTLRKRMPDPEKIAAFYMLSLAWQLVHFVEENSTGFRYRWPTEIFGAKPYGDKQYVAINALSYAVFIVGGVALMTRRPELSLPAVFFALMGVLYNGVQHPIYAYMVKGYFPGLFTGVVDLVLAPFLLRRLFAAPKPSTSIAQLPMSA
jgi:hypothetical protein